MPFRRSRSSQSQPNRLKSALSERDLAVYPPIYRLLFLLQSSPKPGHLIPIYPSKAFSQIFPQKRRIFFPDKTFVLSFRRHLSVLKPFAALKNIFIMFSKNCRISRIPNEATLFLPQYSPHHLSKSSDTHIFAKYS